MWYRIARRSLTDLGDVTGIDLAPAAVEHAKREFPDVRFIAGSCSEAPLAGPFDLVISSEVIAHVADKQGYRTRRGAAASRRDVLLMSQSGFVRCRWNQLRAIGEGMIRNWPRLRTFGACWRLAGQTRHPRQFSAAGGRPQSPPRSEQSDPPRWLHPSGCSWGATSPSTPVVADASS
jgi:hypothetical protein